MIPANLNAIMKCKLSPRALKLLCELSREIDLQPHIIALIAVQTYRVHKCLPKKRKKSKQRGNK